VHWLPAAQSAQPLSRSTQSSTAPSPLPGRTTLAGGGASAAAAAAAASCCVSASRLTISCDCDARRCCAICASFSSAALCFSDMSTSTTAARKAAQAARRCLCCRHRLAALRAPIGVRAAEQGAGEPLGSPSMWRVRILCILPLLMDHSQEFCLSTAKSNDAR
jgi:hypothetical protein